MRRDPARALVAAAALVGVVGTVALLPVTATATPAADGGVAPAAATAPLPAAATASATVPTALAAAPNPANFNPGNIISDAIFYDSTSMDAAAIQAFLEQQNPNCRPGNDGTPCLKDYRETTWTREATARCPGTYVGAANERASDIIAKVARACGINPRVLVVTLQKEQSLVTATGAQLYANRYRSAMGYGCPDTAACDSQYYGFFNQVYSAASQFRNYAQNPTRYAHRAGAVNNVRYHPNAACGSSQVLIQNQATASLYNYTPYQPNAAALAATPGAATGPGSECASYGNRNFWYYFTLWFGTTTGTAPLGFVDEVSPGDLAVNVAGWALDPDTTASVNVRVTIDGQAHTFLADVPRPDVDAVFHLGPNHGFQKSVPAPAGTRNVCLSVLDHDGSAPAFNMGCRTVVVPARPVGFLDTVTTTPTSITVGGWALDPDTSASIRIRVTVDGAGDTYLADLPRPDVGQAFGKGDAHGYSVTVPATPGTHTVCVEALKAAPSRDVTLGCRTVTIVNQAPFGFFDQLSTTPTSVTVGGWALDPDSMDPTTIQVVVDGGTPQEFLANLPRPDVGKIFGKGDNRGYTATVSVGEGRHEVCVRVLDTTTRTPVSLGCRTVTLVNLAPYGFLDAVTATATSVTASGWALDPDTAAAARVQVIVDGGAPTEALADKPRPDVGRALGKGDNRGYSITVPVSPGQHQVCVRVLDATSGAPTSIGCRTVTATSRVPFGFFDSLTGTATGITAAGWAIDPDTTDPIAVHVYVDGVGHAFTADVSRPDVGRAFGMGDRHGFSATVPVAPGRHEVCVYAINVPAGGTNPLFGCRVITTTNATPFGFLDAVTVSAGQVTVSGWALDPDTSDPIDIRVTVDGTPHTARADQSRPDVGQVFGKGDLHGYRATVPATPGTRQVCVVAVNTPAGPDGPIGCRTVTVP